MRASLHILLVSALLAFSSSARADFYIVVNASNSQSMMTRTDALHLFMGRTRTFENGEPAQTFDMPRDSPQRARFYRTLSGMSLAQVASYWARLMFSGQNLPPKPLTDEAAMTATILHNPNAIGWLSSAPTDKGLKTVLILTEEP